MENIHNKPIGATKIYQQRNIGKPSLSITREPKISLEAIKNLSLRPLAPSFTKRSATVLISLKTWLNKITEVRAS